jgi:hypothetical protein
VDPLLMTPRKDKLMHEAHAVIDTINLARQLGNRRVTLVSILTGMRTRTEPCKRKG